MVIEMRRRTWTVDEYYRMAEAGVISADDRIELIDGEIIEMTPMGDRHVACCTWLTNFLVPLVVGRAIVQVAAPISLSERSEPEPDLALLRWKDRYRAKATPADVLLVIEVADSSLAYDRLVKAPLYGRAGIPEYWVVDVERETVEVHDLPDASGYGRTRELGRGSTLTVSGVEGVDLAVADLFG